MTTRARLKGKHDFFSENTHSNFSKFFFSLKITYVVAAANNFVNSVLAKCNIRKIILMPCHVNIQSRIILLLIHICHSTQLGKIIIIFIPLLLYFTCCFACLLNNNRNEEKGREKNRMSSRQCCQILLKAKRMK